MRTTITSTGGGEELGSWDGPAPVHDNDLEVKMREIRAVLNPETPNKLKVVVDGLVIISIRSFGSETTGDVILSEGEEATLRRMELPTHWCLWRERWRG